MAQAGQVGGPDSGQELTEGGMGGGGRRGLAVEARAAGESAQLFPDLPEGAPRRQQVLECTAGRDPQQGGGVGHRLRIEVFLVLVAGGGGETFEHAAELPLPAREIVVGVEQGEGGDELFRAPGGSGAHGMSLVIWRNFVPSADGERDEVKRVPIPPCFGSPGEYFFTWIPSSRASFFVLSRKHAGAHRHFWKAQLREGDDMSSIPLGRRLVVLREAVKLGQKTVAGHLDIKASLLCDYEQGRKNPSPERVEEILRGLALPPRMLDTAGRFLAEVEAARRTLSLPAGDARQEAEDQAELIAWASAWAGSCVTTLVTEGVERVRVVADRQEARRLFGLLRGSTHLERRTLVARAKEYRNWALVVRLCAASEEAAADSAERAMDWARLALEVAVRVEKHDPAWMGKLRAFALVHVANVERVLWQLRKAETRWEEAEPLWQVAGDVYRGRLDEAQWLSLKASLRIEQRRLTEALELVERAETIDRSGLAVSLGLKKGRIFEYMGAYDQAIIALRKEGEQLTHDVGARLMLLQRHNFAVNLCHAGRSAEAASLLPEIRRLAAERDAELASLRVRWLEGRVAMGLGKTDEARETLESVRQSWLELGNAYEMALVSLELAAIYLEKGRTAEVKLLAPQLVPVFRAEDGHGEAAKAVALFCEAVRQEVATAELARQVVAFLYRAWHDPDLRFELPNSENDAGTKGRRTRARRPVY